RGGGDRLIGGLTLAQAGDARSCELGTSAATHAEQACRGAHLEQNVALLFHQPVDAIDKPDRIADMLAPVLRGRGFGHHLAGQVRDDRHAWWLEVDTSTKLLEVVENFVHQW